MQLQPASFDLDCDLARLLRWRPERLRFEPDQEARFQQACATGRLRHFIASGALALVIYNLFLIGDAFMIPDVFALATAVRLMVFTPIALLMLLCGLLLPRLVLRFPTALLEAMLMFTGVAAALTMSWLLMQSSSQYAGLYSAGLVPITVYGNIVQRLRFRFAVAFSLTMIALALFCLLRQLGSPHLYAVFDVPLVLLVCVIAGYTLAMNYRFELEERRRFLWAERTQALQRELAASQAELDAMSRRDPLTGLPNRHHIDQYLLAQWQLQHSAQAGAIGLLLLDVDHFKAYNDRYGHAGGDQCLRHVAQALQEAMPQSPGCLARWGGEEFIAVLPGADMAAAMRLGRDLCEAVRALALRHEASATQPHVTVSVGVAVTTMTRAPAEPASMQTPRGGAQADATAAQGIEALVAQADAALYRAKAAGRDRAVAALSAVGP